MAMLANRGSAGAMPPPAMMPSPDAAPPDAGSVAPQGPMPDISGGNPSAAVQGPQSQPQQPQPVTSAAGHANGIRGLLSQIFQGGADALNRQLGLPTSEEKTQMGLMNMFKMYQLQQEDRKIAAEEATSTASEALRAQIAAAQQAHEQNMEKQNAINEQGRNAREDAANQRLLAMFGIQHQDLQTQRAADLSFKQQSLGLQAQNANFEHQMQASQLGQRSASTVSNQLDKLQNPLDQTMSRMSRLEDTLKQKNPQADALVFPELLTVMAGGQGSGFRMNEAEIARAVGGAVKLTQLKTYMNKWSTDPNHPAIPDEQRQQIENLIGVVKDKLQQKSQLIDNGRNQLMQTDNPSDHLRIYTNTRKSLSGVDTGEQQNTGAPKNAEEYLKTLNKGVD